MASGRDELENSKAPKPTIAEPESEWSEAPLIYIPYISITILTG